MSGQTNNRGPLDALVIADFTQLAQGPWATQMLGDMGAEVIKIEPKKGDWMRHYSYGNLCPSGESISFVSFNRNKGRGSIALNLKDDCELDKTKNTGEWLSLLLDEDIWCSQVNTVDDMVNDPQVEHNEMVIEIDHPSIGTVKTAGFPVSFSETPQRVYRHSPRLNGNAEEILRDLCGYEADDIKTFLNQEA